jgi:hypothetical protein
MPSGGRTQEAGRGNRESAEAKGLMISMTPELIEAAVYAKRTGSTLSGRIAESREEKLRRRAS